MNTIIKPSETIPLIRNAGNRLISSLPPIPTYQESMKHLMNLPEKPTDILSLDFNERLHYLEDLKELYIPNFDGTFVPATLDKLIRTGYKSRNPDVVMQELPTDRITTVYGHSGVGKTTAVLRPLQYYPQIIEHDEFPHIHGKHFQMVWLSVPIPASGRSADFAKALMDAWDQALFKHFGPGHERFDRRPPGYTKDYHDLDTWKMVAKSHYLGILHLDEVQNLFKLSTVKDRQKRGIENRSDLSILEDKFLKWLLMFNQTWNLPLVMSGTYDGMDALMTRFAMAQRISDPHHLQRFKTVKDTEYMQNFLPLLMKYQYVKNPLPLTDKLAELILDCTGGIIRLILKLWIAAHKYAFRRGDDSLRIEDFVEAENKDFVFLREAVTALKSDNPKLKSKYEDMFSKHA